MKAILWDLNGVIIDDEKLQQACWQQTLSEAGLALPENWFDIILGRKIQLSLKELEPGLDEAKAENLIERKNRLYQAESRQIKPGPGVEQMLKAAHKKGIKQALVTGAGKTELRIAMQVIPFQKYMQVMIDGERVKQGKPSPEGYLLAAEKLGVNPEECWVIEDSPSGIKAGKQAGCLCLGLSTSLGPESLKEADIVAGELSGETLEEMIGQAAGRQISRS